MGLSAMQFRYCREIVAGTAPKVAVKRAGYSISNYAKLYTTMYRLSHNPEIQSMIAEMKAERKERLNVAPENVESEVAKLAFVNIQDLYDGKGKLIPVHLLDPVVAAAVSSVEYERKVVRKKKAGEEEVEEPEETMMVLSKVRLHDKKQCLELLARRLGMLKDTLDINDVGAELAKKLTAARERIKAVPIPIKAAKEEEF
ncbi:MAG: terminase small subunit [Dissulfurispiraceae bacterium]|jgi:phage terminase small subunit